MMNGDANSLKVAKCGLSFVDRLTGSFEGISFQREPDRRGGTSPAERFKVRLLRCRSLIYLVLSVPRYSVEFLGELPGELPGH
jgi:hypothetical protein